MAAPDEAPLATPLPSHTPAAAEVEALAASPGPESQTRASLFTPKDPPPRLDTSIASVPLDSIVFDTFRGGFIPLSEAPDEVIEALRDVIKPIYEPKYDPAAG